MDEVGTEVVKTRVIPIDLSTRKLEEPLNAFMVRERGFGIAKYTPDKPFLKTYGLGYCKGIVFYRPKDRMGLICHLSVVKNIDVVVKKLIDNFGGSLNNTKIYLVEGKFPRKERVTSSNFFWPTMQDLIEGFSKVSKEPLFVDFGNDDGKKRGIALNMETGEVSKFFHKSLTCWDPPSPAFTEDMSIKREIF
ncbi:MAG: hypothetical protein ABH812_00900 [bacterium]